MSCDVTLSVVSRSPDPSTTDMPPACLRGRFARSRVTLIAKGRVCLDRLILSVAKDDNSVLKMARSIKDDSGLEQLAT